MSDLNKKSPRFLAVVGPTASGKSSVAMTIARRCRGEIVCCDSVQLYQGFDIGSAKPSKADQSEIPHHLFDAFRPDEPCDAAIYASKAFQVIDEICARGSIPIVTGGTGLYLRALSGENWNQDLPSDQNLRAVLAERSNAQLYAELCELDPVRAKQLHPNDRFRVSRAIEIIRLTGKTVPQPRKDQLMARDHLIVVMDPPRADLHAAIHLRTLEMLKHGLIAEVKGLLAAGVTPDLKPMNSIGYKEVTAFLNHEITEKTLPDVIEAATRQYAKRQCTWFKKIPRDYFLKSVSDLETILPQLLAELS